MIQGAMVKVYKILKDMNLFTQTDAHYSNEASPEACQRVLAELERRRFVDVGTHPCLPAWQLQRLDPPPPKL